MGGDLNLTVSEIEVCGNLARTYSLRNFFNTLFDKKGIVDVQPKKLEPTWRDRRSGEYVISKILDGFLVSEDLFSIPLTISPWLEYGGLSNHWTIMFFIFL